MRALARSLAVLHNKYAVGLQRAMSIISSSARPPYRRRRSYGGAHLARAPSKNIITRAPALSLVFFRADNVLQPRCLCSPSSCPFFLSCLAPAVQNVYPRAPGHRPVTNLRKALEKWNAVCYLAGGPCGSLYWAQREELCGCRAFFGRLGVCKLTLVRLRSAGIADWKVS